MYLPRLLTVLICTSFLVLPACEKATNAPIAGDATVASNSGSSPGQVVVAEEVLWEWVGTVTPVERIEVQRPDHYTLRLQADGTAVMQFDCNRGSGGYEISANQITFGPMVSTRMACPSDSQDFLFMSQLEKITSYFIQDGNLFLEMPYDSGTMHFRPSSNQD